MERDGLFSFSRSSKPALSLFLFVAHLYFFERESTRSFFHHSLGLSLKIASHHHHHRYISFFFFGLITRCCCCVVISLIIIQRCSPGFRLALNPWPSGPLGCLRTTIFLPPRASSSTFIVFSLEMRRSGRLHELKRARFTFQISQFRNRFAQNEINVSKKQKILLKIT